jgi:hypothetical protein
MSLKRTFWWALIAFVIFYVVKYPDDAADTVRSAGEGIGHGFDKFAEFLKQLG